MLKRHLHLKRLSLSASAFTMLAFACEPSESSPEVSPRRPLRPQSSSQESKEPGPPNLPFQNGDLIFHRSQSRQSSMVAALTGSEWTHMGVIFFRGAKPHVLEAVSPLGFTSLESWVARGEQGHYVVKRLHSADSVLNPKVLEKMKDLAGPWLGRPYDMRFEWSDSSFYCSELVYKLYDRAANVQIGKLQKARDMNLDDPLVKKAIDARFGTKHLDPDETIISPASMFRDEKLITVSTK